MGWQCPTDTVTIPANAERIDGAGKHIFPGLIDAASEMGLFEIGGVDVAVDVELDADLRALVLAIGFDLEDALDLAKGLENNPACGAYFLHPGGA